MAMVTSPTSVDVRDVNVDVRRCALLDFGSDDADPSFVR